ncbi:TIGR04222 domain-containing membrane protein [Actinomadura sp. 3N508]|uniref:TIGR04222 domain-containing membrane protein n=1 Tax=Actinomadura sp. 3N508 TaxID=3375153 RepID=UPI00379ED1BA
MRCATRILGTSSTARATTRPPTTATASTRSPSPSNPRNRGRAGNRHGCRNVLLDDGASRGGTLDELDRYTTAYLCGGPSRVVLVAVLALYERRAIRISRATRRAGAVVREPGDPVEEAVLTAIPNAGRPLGQVIAEAAESAAALAVADALREAGLMRGRRPTRRGRALRRSLIGEPGASQAGRLAVLGPDGVEDARLRAILQAKDPKPIALPRDRHRGHRNLGAGNRSDPGFDAGDYGGGSGGGD